MKLLCCTNSFEEDCKVANAPPPKKKKTKTGETRHRKPRALSYMSKTENQYSKREVENHNGHAFSKFQNGGIGKMARR